MNNSIPPLLEKLRQVFDVLDFSQEKKEKLLSELLDGVFTLAMAKTLKENPDLTEKLNAVDTQNLTAGKLDSLSNVLDSNAQSVFTKELQTILNDYILQLITTVDVNKKQRIQDIWKSEESPVSSNKISKS